MTTNEDSKELSKLRGRLSRWRSRHGGRGRPIPEALWSAAVDVAMVAGVDATARSLGLDRARLGRRVASTSAPAPSARGARESREVDGTAFVQLDARQVLGGGEVVVRLTNARGDRLEVACSGGGLDVLELSRRLWEGVRCCS